MNINSIIVDTLKPIVPNVYPLSYEGESREYITFNRSNDVGINFADDEPEDNQIDVMIHLFTPNNTKPYEKKIRKALFKAGFTYPEITMEQYEDSKRLNHITFECSYVETIEL